MTVPSDHELTRLLRAWQDGAAGAGTELVPLVYRELRKIAAARLRAERDGHTLQPTALVHEAWVRLMRQQGADWQSREQFFAIAARMMRRILVDHARRRQAAKRGEAPIEADVDELASRLASPLPDERLLALNDALDRLAALDARQAQVVEFRFFGGLSVEETANVLSLSPTTVKREWATARAWLFRTVQGGIQT
jgi:RNA polymerase sigma factor (TIGR02999 family)